MFTDLLLIIAPLALGILMVAGGADITDRDYLKEINRERESK